MDEVEFNRLVKKYMKMDYTEAQAKYIAYRDLGEDVPPEILATVKEQEDNLSMYGHFIPQEVKKYVISTWRKIPGKKDNPRPRKYHVTEEAFKASHEKHDGNYVHMERELLGIAAKGSTLLGTVRNLPWWSEGKYPKKGSARKYHITEEAFKASHEKHDGNYAAMERELLRIATTGHTLLGTVRNLPWWSLEKYPRRALRIYHITEDAFRASYEKYDGNYTAMERELLGIEGGGKTLHDSVQNLPWWNLEKYPRKGRRKYHITEEAFKASYEKHYGHYATMERELLGFENYGRTLIGSVQSLPWWNSEKYPPKRREKSLVPKKKLNRGQYQNAVSMALSSKIGMNVPASESDKEILDDADMLLKDINDLASEGMGVEQIAEELQIERAIVRRALENKVKSNPGRSFNPLSFYKIDKLKFEESYLKHKGYYKEIAKELIDNTARAMIRSLRLTKWWSLEKYPKRFPVDKGSKSSKPEETKKYVGKSRPGKPSKYNVSEKSFVDAYEKKSGDYGEMEEDLLGIVNNGYTLKRVVKNLPWWSEEKYPSLRKGAVRPSKYLVTEDAFKESYKKHSGSYASIEKELLGREHLGNTLLRSVKNLSWWSLEKYPRLGTARKYHISEEKFNEAYKKYPGNYFLMAKALLGEKHSSSSLTTALKRMSWWSIEKYPSRSRTQAGQDRRKYHISEEQFNEAYKKFPGNYYVMGQYILGEDTGKSMSLLATVKNLSWWSEEKYPSNKKKITNLDQHEFEEEYDKNNDYNYLANHFLGDGYNRHSLKQVLFKYPWWSEENYPDTPSEDRKTKVGYEDLGFCKNCRKRLSTASDLLKPFCSIDCLDFYLKKNNDIEMLKDAKSNYQQSYPDYEFHYVGESAAEDISDFTGPLEMPVLLEGSTDEIISENIKHLAFIGFSWREAKEYALKKAFPFKYKDNPKRKSNPTEQEHQKILNYVKDNTLYSIRSIDNFELSSLALHYFNKLKHAKDDHLVARSIMDFIHDVDKDRNLRTDFANRDKAIISLISYGSYRLSNYLNKERTNSKINRETLKEIRKYFDISKATLLGVKRIASGIVEYYAVESSFSNFQLWTLFAVLRFQENKKDKKGNLIGTEFAKEITIDSLFAVNRYNDKTNIFPTVHSFDAPVALLFIHLANVYNKIFFSIKKENLNKVFEYIEGAYLSSDTTKTNPEVILEKGKVTPLDIIVSQERKLKVLTNPKRKSNPDDDDSNSSPKDLKDKPSHPRPDRFLGVNRRHESTSDVDQDIKDLVINLYKGNESIERIARRVDLTKRLVKEILIEANVTIKKGGPVKPNPSIPKFKNIEEFKFYKANNIYLCDLHLIGTTDELNDILTEDAKEQVVNSFQERKEHADYTVTGEVDFDFEGVLGVDVNPGLKLVKIFLAFRPGNMGKYIQSKSMVTYLRDIISNSEIKRNPSAKKS